MKPLDPSLRTEIDALSDALDAVLKKQPRLSPADFPAPLQARRRALLERHLGFPLPQDLPLIHSVGDSHSMFFSGAERMRFIRYGSVGFWRRRYINRSLDLLPCFRVFHTGPATAWKAAEFGSSTRNREKIEWLLRKRIPARSTVLLSFGEIDCRIHMPKQVLGGRSVAEVTRTTAERLMPLFERVKSLGFTTAAWGVAQISPRDENDPRLALPAVGPLELRHEITYAFNEAVAGLCRSSGITHLAMAGTYHPPAEPVPEACLQDGVHLSQVMMPHALRLLGKAGLLPIPG